MIKTNNKEKVLVVPSNLLFEVGYFEGICTDVVKYLSAINTKSLFKERGLVENDIYFKQIVIYAIIHCRGKILRYRRGPKLLESRLMNKLSIGIGGHVTLEDSKTNHDNYISCLYRELNEEIYINTKFNKNIVATLNDDSNSVGAVHFGIIIILDLAEPNVKQKEKSILECQFIDKNKLIDDYNEYERWSQICINNIDNLKKLGVKSAFESAD